MSTSPFIPNGKCTCANVVAGTGSSFTTAISTGLCNTLLVVNTGASPVFYSFTANVSVTPSAIIPLSNASANGLMIAPGDSHVVGLPNADASSMHASQVKFAANVASGYSSIYVTPVIKL